jgi:hypothetical protein
MSVVDAAKDRITRQGTPADEALWSLAYNAALTIKVPSKGILRGIPEQREYWWLGLKNLP